MSVKSDFFQGRYWLPGLIVTFLVFLTLTVLFGYLFTKNTRTDQDNLTKIENLQFNSANVIFLTRRVVTGDTAALRPIEATIANMDKTVDRLLEADDFTRDRMPVQYQEAGTLWRSIDDNVGILTQVKPAIDQLNTLQLELSTAAAEASELARESIEFLARRGASANQGVAVSVQASLIRKMSDNLSAFMEEESSSPQYFDNFRNNFEIFSENHSYLTGESRAGASPPQQFGVATGSTIIKNLSQMNDSLEGLRSSLQSVIQASEQLLLAREAEQRMLASFQDFQSLLADMQREMIGVAADRFPKPYHFLITLAGLIISIIMLALYQRSVARRETDVENEQVQKSQEAILRLLDELVDLADGDLTVSATVSEDFTGAIADSINFTIDQLRQLVARINSTAVEVSQAAQGTRQTALHLAEASDHQAQEIADVSEAVNEMAVTIDRVSANASESSLVAGKSVSIANNGAQIVQNTIHGMDTIREQIQDTSKRIKRLGESSQEIGDIVSLINDIADQTNILALNAAIQASMAGDAGRGFAVVADEVQRLAERSAAATKQIETIVKTIQTDTNEAVTSMEQTTSEVVNGARLAQDAGVALGEIENVSANLAELIQNISGAARQQASSAGQISNTMNVIQEITSQTSAGTAATAQSIGELVNVALNLRESVAGFTLPADMVADLEDHKATATSGEHASTVDADLVEDSSDNDAVEFNDAVVDANTDNLEMQELMDELGVTEEDLAQSGDFFELLLGEGDDEYYEGDDYDNEKDDDLLSEFDVDLSEIEFPDNRKSIG